MELSFQGKSDMEVLEREIIHNLNKLETSEENMVCLNSESQDLDPVKPKLLRTMFMQTLPKIISGVENKNIFSSVREQRVVAEVECSNRLEWCAEDLKTHYKFMSALNADHEKVLEQFKKSKNELVEVKNGMDEIESEDGDREYAELERLFRDCKSDLSYVLDNLCPEYKKDIKDFLTLLESKQTAEKWHKLPTIKSQAINLLLQSKIIVQHPELVNYFRLAV